MLCLNHKKLSSHLGLKWEKKTMSKKIRVTFKKKKKSAVFSRNGV